MEYLTYWELEGFGIKLNSYISGSFTLSERKSEFFFDFVAVQCEDQIVFSMNTSGSNVAFAFEPI